MTAEEKRKIIDFLKTYNEDRKQLDLLRSRLNNYIGACNNGPLDKKEAEKIEERYNKLLSSTLYTELLISTLSKNERTVIEHFYLSDMKYTEAVAKLESKLNYSERQINRIRQAALIKINMAVKRQ